MFPTAQASIYSSSITRIYTNKTYWLPCSFSAVLVAHNGFAFDFPLLLAEIERGQLNTSFHDHNISFADSLIGLRQVRCRYMHVASSTLSL